MAARTGGKWSVISIAEARKRIASRRLDAASAKLLAGARLEGDVLWHEGHWHGPPKSVPADLDRVALLVFDGPVSTETSLTLNAEDLVGGFAARDETAFLFLGEVRARDVNAVPGVLAVFAAGLVVERLASFDGADTHAQVAHHLRAPLVVSNLAGGTLYLSPGTDATIGAYARYISGLRKGVGTEHDSLAELLPFAAEHAGEFDAWEVFESHLKDVDFPDDFEMPSLAGARGTAAKKTAAKKRAAKKPSAKKATPKKATPKKKAPKRRR